MARDLSPKWKRCRREKYSLFSNDDWKRRSTLPGEHPVSRARPSAYAVRFREKQKVKRMYGLLERQFKRFLKIAEKFRGNTGNRLLQLLELRLDNVVYRLGFAPTRAAARQIVVHKHITVNGKVLNIPSHILSVGDEIGIKSNSQKREFIKIFMEECKKNEVPKWLDRFTTSGKIKIEPARESIDRGINETLIIEFYAR